jgi:hypothetical protein
VLKQTALTGSHEHVDKLLPPPWVVVLLPFHHLLLPGWGTWMDGWWDKWMKRTTTQGYYISRQLCTTKIFKSFISVVIRFFSIYYPKVPFFSLTLPKLAWPHPWFVWTEIRY